tara:strand:- start:77 stop:352 length:276 start_codon:yes stop_codon:yes gene_type:complete
LTLDRYLDNTKIKHPYSMFVESHTESLGKMTKEIRNVLLELQNDVSTSNADAAPKKMLNKLHDVWLISGDLLTMAKELDDERLRNVLKRTV